METKETTLNECEYECKNCICEGEYSQCQEYIQFTARLNQRNSRQLSALINQRSSIKTFK